MKTKKLFLKRSLIIISALMLSTGIFSSKAQSRLEKKNIEIVKQFEDEFKNKANVNIVDELMSEDFVLNTIFPGNPQARDGMKSIGQAVFSMISDIKVEIVFIIADGDLVANRVQAKGNHKESGKELSWTENHFYKIKDGKITEWWGEGAPNLN